MAEALILESEALNALSRASSVVCLQIGDSDLDTRARRRALVRVPAPVLARYAGDLASVRMALKPAPKSGSTFHKVLSRLDETPLTFAPPAQVKPDTLSER